MLHGGTLLRIGNLGVNAYLTAELSVYGEVAEVSLGHRHQCNVAKYSRWRPVVIIVEVAAGEACYHLHGKLLLAILLVDIWRDVKEGGVISGAP